MDTSDTTPPPPNTGDNNGGDSVPGWCLITAQFAEDQGTPWSAKMCEDEMVKDVSDIMKDVDNYLVDVDPNDNAQEMSLVIDSFDNRSSVESTSSDDPYWTMELRQRVLQKLQAEGRDVRADEKTKAIIKSSVNRKSKLSRRSFYDYRGGSGTPEFGDLSTVFKFSGRA